MRRILTVWFVVMLFPSATISFAEVPVIEVPPENPISEEKRLLGKVLFWDEQLSSDNTVACGTCHIPSAGGADPRIALHPGADLTLFSDDDVLGSFGVVKRDEFNQPVIDPVFGTEQQVTGRSAPAFFMGIFAESNFWDGRAGPQLFDPLTPETLVISDHGSLENQALGPILSSVEMAHQARTWQQVTDKLLQATPLALASNIPSDVVLGLSESSTYPLLFAAAFGDENITPVRIAMAIASYERTLIPDQSPWDLYVAGDDAAMTAQQIEGWELWEQETVCGNCHKPPLFTDNQFYNIGLRPGEEDSGRQQVTGVSDDFGRFKTPSLRNSGLKKSLMHVGWITGVQDAVDFYNAETNDTGHHQFTADQSSIPTQNGDGVDYDTLSMFGASAERQAIIVDFMANALTDPRVAAETFPFDRPTLKSERIQNADLSSELKMLTYNVSSADWTSVRADQVAEVIRTINADVVGVQEALNDQQDDLESRLSDIYDFHRFGEDNNDPILVKKGLFTLIKSAEVATSVDCGSTRYLNYLILELVQSEHWLAFYNQHFCATVGGSNIEENQQQAIELINLVADNLLLYPSSNIVVGDFNAAASSDTVQFLIESQSLPNGATNPLFLDDSWQTAFNGSADKPVPIDWIFHTPYNVIVNAADVFENELTDIASDHLPLTVMVQLSYTYVVANVDESVEEDAEEDAEEGEEDTNTSEQVPDSSEGSSGGSISFLVLFLLAIFARRGHSLRHKDW